MAATQDWNQIVFHKKPAAAPVTSKDKQKVAQEAMRKGQTVQTVKKTTAGTNKASKAQDASHLRAIDEETEDFHIEKVSLSVGKRIQQARVAKGWTQKELAQKINEKSTVVNSYENGTAIPSAAVTQKLARTLGVSLSDKPKPKPKPKPV